MEMSQELYEILNELEIDHGEDTDGETCIIFDSWDQVRELEERYPDFENEVDFTSFDDEYISCYNCMKFVRISPNSYGWRPEYFVCDDGLFCEACILEDDDLIEQYIDSLKNRLRSHNLGVDLKKYGYTKLDLDFAVGLHECTYDSPEKILQLMTKNEINVIFEVFPSQFEQDFEIWVDQPEKALELLDKNNIQYDPGMSPGQQCARILREISIISKER